MTEVTFDTMSGVDINGWWSNPRTGESYHIVDSFFQDNVLYGRTDKGQMINFSKIQNFVKSDKPLTKPVERIQPDKKQVSKLLEGLSEVGPAPSAGVEMFEDDLEIISRSSQSGQVSRTSQESKNSNSRKASESDVEDQILDKAFSKVSAPSVSLEIDTESIRNIAVMLTDMMGIDGKKIAKYITRRYISDLEDSIENKILESLFPDSVEVYGETVEYSESSAKNLKGTSEEQEN